MNKKISPINYLFMLAYAYELDWDYIEREIGDDELESSSLFEVMSLTLALWGKRIIAKNLYKSFQSKQKKTQRLRGKVLFGRDMQQGDTRSPSLTCEYDEVSFDVVENRILLATTKLCRDKLTQVKKDTEIKKRRNSIEGVIQKLSKVYRRLRSEVSLQPLRREMFKRVTYTRANKHYEPTINLCKLIFESNTISSGGVLEAIKESQDEGSRIFERFLRNYLKGQFADTDISIDKKRESNWVKKVGGGSVDYIPSIQPDIVVRQDGKPIFVLDAKFYKEVMKEGQYDSQNLRADSGNLYQIISYQNYYNCDGMLVYAETERDHFEEMVKISPDYYNDSRAPDREFGVFTVDMSGNVADLKDKMEIIENRIKKRMTDQVKPTA